MLPWGRWRTACYHGELDVTMGKMENCMLPWGTRCYHGEAVSLDDDILLQVLGHVDVSCAHMVHARTELGPLHARTGRDVLQWWRKIL